ncbi:MAG: cation:proton antiporter [Euryarchaeota archaeon]|nr:cation:proton antiporter [Euryarchaeota archaeon]
MISIWLVAALILMICIFLAIARAVAGPTLADRVVALDTINTLIVAIMIILSVVYSEVIYVDIAIVYALLSFVATLYMAKYIEGGF